MAKGHRLVVVAEWKDARRRAYANLMDALSYGDLSTEAWLILIGEAMAPIAGAKWEARYPVGHWESCRASSSRSIKQMRRISVKPLQTKRGATWYMSVTPSTQRVSEEKPCVSCGLPSPAPCSA